jgi:hypothetical protein
VCSLENISNLPYVGSKYEEEYEIQEGPKQISTKQYTRNSHDIVAVHFRGRSIVLFGMDGLCEIPHFRLSEG